jgi:hypothetical protein
MERNGLFKDILGVALEVEDWQFQPEELLNDSNRMILATKNQGSSL